MFSGIIKEIGHIKKKTHGVNDSLKFEISSAKIKAHVGDSIAVNGVCLTVSQKKQKGFVADIVPETLAKTNLGFQKENSPLNLEPALNLKNALNGHFVLGHIDAVGKILKREQTRGKVAPRKAGLGLGEILTIKFPKKLKPFIAEKGSIAINGVSLTVASTASNFCKIALIPFTLLHTNLGGLKKGDLVNIEIDILARYLYKMTKK